MSREERVKRWNAYWTIMASLGFFPTNPGLPLSFDAATAEELENAARREVESLLRSIKGVKP